MPVEYDGSEIAVVGLACRFPGANDSATYWAHLRDGVASIRHFSDQELKDAGVDEARLRDPSYVKAAAFLDRPEEFDAAFFGMSHREAEITDPQHRVLLELGHQVLEDAAHTPDRFAGRIGVFAGATLNSYLVYHLAADAAALSDLEPVQLNIGNGGDFLTTRMAYKLNLKGPCYTVQSACSTSLVAVHVACESLLNEECDMALAGGVSINVGFRHGYHHVEGGMVSPDGICRPFDAKAQGTIFGSGAGLVALRRLEDALADGDTIRAVVRGTAINNDGSLKVGYTAPSVDGQAKVIREALESAGLRADDIGYVEAHGTATSLGDPIEVEALSKAWRPQTQRRGFCALGSVKGNVGHLDAAAGIAGFIKTVLSLDQGHIPPSLHFERPNPNIDFAASPFYVNGTLSPWPTGRLRRAAVSAFGVGGTNAHVVLEEPPLTAPAAPSSPHQLLVLSAKTTTAVNAMATRLADYLDAHPEVPLADVAYTLKQGRQTFKHRRFVAASDVTSAREALRLDGSKVEVWDPDTRRPLAFLLSGQGSQFPNMGQGLYRQYPLFRRVVDDASVLLQDVLGVDLRQVMYPPEGAETDAAERLQDTAMAQVALFVVEYGLAKLLMSWGLRPTALAGHSIGELVAATLAGVFGFEDGLRLVAERGRLMSELPTGAMLSVPLTPEALADSLEVGLEVAVINGTDRIVVSGSEALVDGLAQRLRKDGVESRRLHTSHGFHSKMMQGAVVPFKETVGRLTLGKPQIPFMSNVSGTWITDEQACDPGYWADHLRHTVRFSDNLEGLLEDPSMVLVELGPGQMLTRLGQRHSAAGAGHRFVSLLGHPESRRDELEGFVHGLGRLWTAGVEIDGKAYFGDETRRRVALPGYPFDRRRYWIEPRTSKAEPSAPKLAKLDDIGDWLHEPVWRRIPRPQRPLSWDTARRTWLLFAASTMSGEALRDLLRQHDQDVVVVRAASEFAETAWGYTLQASEAADYGRLFEALKAQGRFPDKILHLWQEEASGPEGAMDDDAFDEAQQKGLFSLLHLVQAMESAAPGHPADLLLVTRDAVGVTALEALSVSKATSLGAARVVPQEHPHLSCRVLDLRDESASPEPLLDVALHEDSQLLALRGGQFWTADFQPLASSAAQPKLRQGGVYLITGGLEEIGVEQAECLAVRYGARLALQVEADFPPQETWSDFLAERPAHRTSSMIRAAQGLQEKGDDLLLLPVDPDDGRGMAGVPSRVIARFGALHGVIHNGRLTGERSFRTLAETGVESCQWQLTPKVKAVRHLTPALLDLDLDFVLLNSSMGALLGGFGTFAYAAANRYLDALAQEMRRRGAGLWMSVNWDAWQKTQIAGLSQDLALFALSGDEGGAVLERILHSESPAQVVVSTVDLKERMAIWSQRGHFSAEASPEVPSVRHARPDLETLYQPPATDSEKLVAEIWQRILGIERIGVVDSFFELGGDSLTAVQTAAQLEKAIGQKVPVVDLYDGLTVRSLAKAIDGLEGAAAPRQKPLDTSRQERRSRRRDLQQQQRSRRRSRPSRTSS